MDWWRTVQFITVILLAVAILDQLAKAAIVSWIGPEQPHQRWEVAGRLAAFEYVENTGAAFGLFAGRAWLLSAGALMVALGFVAAFWRDLPRSGALRISVGLVLGGAIGNLVDRMRLGHVVDYLAIGAWPKFNVADSAITIGLVALAYCAFADVPSRGKK